MISLLISIVVILVIAWLLVLIVSQLPAMPGFVPTIIWVLALLFILIEVVDRFGPEIGLH
jgi:hypothetical protein